MSSMENNNPRLLRRIHILRIFLAATITTLLVTFSSYAVRVSNMDVYQELRLGMSRADAMNRLRNKGIDCGSITPFPKDLWSRPCWFSDPWRSYEIGFNSGDDNHVIRKSYVFNRPKASLVRILKHFF
jgi:hypothetical protein